MGRGALYPLMRLSSAGVEVLPESTPVSPPLFAVVHHREVGVHPGADEAVSTRKGLGRVTKRVGNLNTYSAIIGSSWRSEVLADRFSSNSIIALELPRTTMC